MPRRDFITPSTLPAETQSRVITIPASQEWLGLINAALLMLTEEWRYEQLYDTSLTPEATVAAAYEIYVAYLTAVCDMACCQMRYNPFNGRLQQSDDGLTWLDVADGPWTESLYPVFSAMPQPRPETTDAQKKCAAAATAAYVLRNLYAQTGNTLLNVVAATDWEYAGALGSMLGGFLLTIGAAALQPFVAIASLLGIVGVRDQYVDYPLDSADEEQMTCILLENATLESSGAVTFDFNGVYGAIDLDSPKNGLMRFLLTMIGPDALNYAGAIDAGLTPDCDTCGEWCYRWDMTSTDGGFAPQTNPYDGQPDGFWTASVGWQGNDVMQGAGDPENHLVIERSFDETNVESVIATVVSSGVAWEGYIKLYLGASEVGSITWNSAATSRSWAGDVLADRVEFAMYRNGHSVTARLTSLQMSGHLFNPIGEDNCP